MAGDGFCINLGLYLGYPSTPKYVEGTRLACRRQGAEGNVGAEGVKLACLMAMCLSMGMPKATQSLHVVRQCG
ncbi:unnamed protein product [Prunus armeniaca]